MGFKLETKHNLFNITLTVFFISFYFYVKKAFSTVLFIQRAIYYFQNITQNTNHV